MKIKIIAAIGKHNELGNKNSLPLWNLQTDFKRFKELTTGKTVVMGRKTFESLPEKFRPLPNRQNIVITRDKNWEYNNVKTFENLLDLQKNLINQEEIWIIGGGEIYKQFLGITNELHITHVDGKFKADTFFPQIDKNIWKITRSEIVPADNKNSHQSTYTIYARL